MDDVLENVENQGIHQTMSSLALLTVQVSIRTTIKVSVHEYSSISSQMQALQVQNREFLLVIVATNDTVCRKEAQIKAHQNLASSKHSHSNDMSLQQLMPHVFGLL